ncbi:LuxR family transcriptional regulator [Arthrobacter sp. TS-15]|uniref:LuxR C-terminal-related transcriptional regulator n=1 Tax=Arthrobacter sp. TS-15 TaxID=2510797 RepID=UPI00115E3201|nr:LuxR C-terminal-related transcriptional regulator [Arthrobacter sp. TS-15]TQS87371.1 LuxR family transcriptional regulator [Arthrobacter sp. TS-15]
MTSFVGRRREVLDARSRIAESRLVTLTGPGGVGKTRLALEVAEKSRRAFRDGICLVELASLEDGSGVASRMAAALMLQDQSHRPVPDKLISHLRDTQMLIILDNCEHVLASTSDLVALLLREAPSLHILTTSREPLSLPGENICVISPLTTPSPADIERPECLDRYEAVQLLIDRTRSVYPNFSITAENSDAVVQLCHRLDGIPLAIELAATRLRSLTVVQFVKRMDKRFELLSGGYRTSLPRQQTLSALIDWSYELCTDTEKLLWARLSVFPGSFDLEAAEDVCGFGGQSAEGIPDILDRLVAKSIVLTERRGELLRYRLLMTMREYGSQKLELSDAESVLRQRHRDHYLSRAAGMVDSWCGPGQAGSLARMREDHANLISALDWSVQTPGEVAAGAALVTMLRYHWIAGGFLNDGRLWLDRMLSEMGGSSAARGETLWVAAWVALIQGDRAGAARYLADSRLLAAELDDPVLEAHTSHWEGLHKMFSGDLPAAIQLFQHARDFYLSTGDSASVLDTVFVLGPAQAYNSQLDDALATCRDGLDLSARRGERWSRAYILWTTGVVRWIQGDIDGAREAAVRALELQREFKDGICTALVIELLSWIAASAAQFAKAADLAEAACAVWTSLGTTVEAFGPHIQGDSMRTAGEFKKALGSRHTPSLTLTKEEAILVGLGMPAASMVETTSPLTKRELKVAQLVSGGLTNRAIAEALVISPRTVGGHVENILSKLGVNSRTQIATWVTANEPQRS